MPHAMTTAASCASAIQHAVGLGTFMMDRPTVPAAIRSALSLGYRRIDCAPVYFNEDIVGDTLQEAMGDHVVTREDLFVVSKLASPFHRREHVELAVRKTLSDLRLDHLDLYLVHWPVAFYPVAITSDPTTSIRGRINEEIDASDGGKRIDPTVSIHETWQAMEALVDQGLVRHIGVSNFPVALLHELMTQARIPPAVNQCEAHPYLQQTKLVEYCKARGVHFQAYSPLGTPGFKERDEPVVLDDPVLNEIAKRHGVSVAAVCLAWAVQRGTSVVAKSTNPQHLRDNLEAATSSDIRLSEEDMAAIASLDRGYRFFRPEDWWGKMAMAVFD
jgi:alcohol dehydrogenase (NADP+)